MNALLTSDGLTNQTIIDIFTSLLPKPINEIKVVDIPTASKQLNRKAAIQNHVNQLLNLGCKTVDLVEISEGNKSDWMPYIDSADVIFVEGGDVYYLKDQIIASGLTQELPRLLQQKVYVGISAGSRVLNPDISVVAAYPDPSKSPDGLNITNYCIIPHMSSSKFPNRRPEDIEPLVSGAPYITYLIDDNSAVLVEGDSVSIIGEGNYREFRS